MRVVVLDSGALSSLARGGLHERTVRAALTAATKTGAKVLAPAVVLAELYRGGGHDQALDAYLAREGGIEIVPTDRSLARVVGNILSSAGRGSTDHVDATVIAVCTKFAGAIVVTGDPTDLSALSAGHPAITIQTI